MVSVNLHPHDADAERSVLGCLLLDPCLALGIGQILKAEDFHVDRNRRLFEHMLALWDEHSCVNPQDLLARLRQHGDCDALGGAGYLAELLKAASCPLAMLHYAEVVADHSKLRREFLR